MTETAALLLTALIAGLGGALVNVVVVSRAAGKFEGRVEERFKACDTRFESLENSRSEQWKEINSLGQRASYIEAKVNGKAHHA